MKNLVIRLCVPSLLSLIVFLGVYYWQSYAALSLRSPQEITGWSLVCVIVFLMMFNLRKKLQAFNLGIVKIWFALHVAFGLLAVAFFVLHTGSIWPQGLYEQLLALAFWAVSLSGIVGVFITVTFPRRLTDTGFEIIYEKIPEEIYNLKNEAEKAVTDCAKDSGEQTLVDHYNQTLVWFFRKPRFYWSVLFGGQASKAWVNRHFEPVERYLSNVEITYLESLKQLAERKCLVDEHYARQDIMKKWLLAHVPLSLFVLAMSVWHVTLIYSYSL